MPEMTELLTIFKALSDRNRLRILAALFSQSACVCELGWALSINQSNLSRHLQVLENAGLIEGEHIGNWVEYRLNSEAHTKILLDFVMATSINEAQFKADRLKLSKADRSKICKKKGLNV